MDFCCNTRLWTSNSIIFKGCFYIHIGNILYKYLWNCSLDNKFMNLYLTVCPRVCVCVRACVRVCVGVCVCGGGGGVRVCV